MAYKILTIYERLRKDLLNGSITVRKAAEELHRAGCKNYIPDRAETLKYLDFNSICFDCINSECTGTTCQTWTGCIYRKTERRATK